MIQNNHLREALVLLPGFERESTLENRFRSFITKASSYFSSHHGSEAESFETIWPLLRYLESHARTPLDANLERDLIGELFLTCIEYARGFYWPPFHLRMYRATRLDLDGARPKRLFLSNCMTGGLILAVAAQYGKHHTFLGVNETQFMTTCCTVNMCIHRIHGQFASRNPRTGELGAIRMTGHTSSLGKFGITTLSDTSPYRELEKALPAIDVLTMSEEREDAQLGLFTRPI